MKNKLEYPLSHPLNKDNVKKFIAASAPDARNAVDKFIKNTTYITYETFIGYINHNLAAVVKQLQEDRPIFVYIDYYNQNKYYKQKSNFWLYLYINQIAAEKYNKKVYMITHLNKRTLKDDDIVLLVDDCIYSGTQMSDVIRILDNPRNKYLHLILFVPFLSHEGANRVIENFEMNENLYDCTFSFSDIVFYISPLSRYMDANEYINIIKYYRNYEGKDFRLNTDAQEDICKYPIYFDHKVADYMSSFPEIYGGLVPNDHNLQNTKEIDVLINESKENLGNPRTKEWRSKMTKLRRNFQIYPLITHCEHLDTPEFTESSCPVPPYKKKLYTDFIHLIKKKPRAVRSLSEQLTKVSKTKSKNKSTSKSTSKSSVKLAKSV